MIKRGARGVRVGERDESQGTHLRCWRRDEGGCSRKLDTATPHTRAVSLFTAPRGTP